MWHTTDETPREGARVICIIGAEGTLRWFRYGSKAIELSIRAKIVWGGTRLWAYAPGEEAE